jgi:FHS family L-fucose permease-like MFS transporter
MLGRFGGSVLMKSISAPRLLSIFGAGSLVSIIVALSANGPGSVWALVLIGFFHFIMFPTIFALSIKNLGPLTKRGSSLQVMAILGGAILPAIMGRISDATNIRTAFVVPLVCYVYIFYFAVSGYRPRNAASEEAPTMARMAQES